MHVAHINTNLKMGMTGMESEGACISDKRKQGRCPDTGKNLNSRNSKKADSARDDRPRPYGSSFTVSILF